MSALRRLGTRQRWGIIAAVVVAAVAASVAVAMSATVDLVLSDPSPPPGARVAVVNPRISIAASDTTVVAPVQPTFTVDGATYAGTFEYKVTGGHYEGDGCDMVWVTDYDLTQGIASFSRNLTDGSHTVTATVTDVAGRSASSAWSFFVAAPPTVSYRTPADGALVKSAAPNIWARLADNGTIASASMTLDGKPFGTWNPASKDINGTPSQALADGPHTATVSATDAVGATMTSSWTFTTQNVPSASFSSARPSTGTTATVWDPLVSVVATDITSLTRATMTIDGAAVTPTFSSSGTSATVSYRPKMLDDGTHTASVDVWNANGCFTTYSWTFAVSAPPRIDTPTPPSGGWATTLTPTLTAKVTENGAVASAAATVDGVAVAATYDPATRSVRTTVPWQLSDDASHTAAFDVMDAYGNTGSFSWGFSTHATLPVFGPPTPEAGAHISASSVDVSIDASDAVGLAGTSSFVIDGRSVPGRFAYRELNGHWEGSGCDTTWVYDTDYYYGTASCSLTGLGDGTHTVTAQVPNSRGGVGSYTWSLFTGEPPAIASVSPANGSVVATLNPTITARVTDNGSVAAVTLLLDGLPTSGGYDPATKVFTGRALAPLTEDTSHTAVVMATDDGGLTSSYMWSFRTHVAAPTLSAATPADGTTTATASPRISIDAYDWSGMGSSPQMYVDGASVPAVWGYVVTADYWTGTGCDTHEVIEYDYTRGTASYRPPKLDDGEHTVSVRLANSVGTVATRAWKFTVESPPALTDPRPAPASWATTRGPEISLGADDNTLVRSVAATVDGASVTATYDAAAKRVRVTPPALLDNDVDHTVAVRVTDGAGNVSSQSWTFHIQTYPAMPSSSSCTDCHTTYPAAHPMANCDACHAGGRPVEDCRTCHGTWPHGPDVFDRTDWAGPYACTRCHDAAFADKVPQHPADVTPLHNTSHDMSTCRPCHVTPLTTEHYRHPDSAGNAMTCATCHSSTDTAVRAAVAAGDSDCGACHAKWEHMSMHEEPQLGDQCAGCHEKNLVKEHLYNTRTQSAALVCDSCHKSASSAVRWAIDAGDGSCSACHSSAHGQTLTATAAGVPLYSGVRWSRPMETKLFAGEPWLPSAFSAEGRIVVSSRSAGLDGGAVASFYDSTLAAQGWTRAGAMPASGAGYYTVTWTKSTHSIVLIFYSAERHAASPPASAGSRMEVLFK